MRKIVKVPAMALAVLLALSAGAYAKETGKVYDEPAAASTSSGQASWSKMTLCKAAIPTGPETEYRQPAPMKMRPESMPATAGGEHALMLYGAKDYEYAP